MAEPHILFADIETTGMLLFGYRTGKQVITHDQILKYPQVICISYAWDNQKIQNLVFDLSKFDWYAEDDYADYEVMKKFISVANQADLIVLQNGKMFDIPFLRSRIVRYRLPDLKPTLVDDTYLQTKDIAFPSHKLDFMGKFLGIGGKAEHGHGVEWWVEVLRGNKQILKKMVHYCDVDVKRMRDYYNIVKPYIKTNLNRAIFSNDPSLCPKCGQRGTLTVHDSNRVVGLQVKTQYRCKNCGSYVTYGTNKIKKQKDFPRLG